MTMRLIVQTLIWIGAMGALLFIPAGTLAWPGAWAFLIEMLVLGLAIGLLLLRSDPDLVKERLGSLFQKDQPSSDKALMALLMPLFVAWLVFMGLDAQRFGWSEVPVWAQGLGALCLLVSVFVGYRTMRENSFAAPVVKIQRERGQKVVTTGPYAYVRHPMYAGALFYFVGAPLLLGSWRGLAFFPLFTGLLVARIGIEETALRTSLPGYDAYSATVRYRLVPGVW